MALRLGRNLGRPVRSGEPGASSAGPRRGRRAGRCLPLPGLLHPSRASPGRRVPSESGSVPPFSAARTGPADGPRCLRGRAALAPAARPPATRQPWCLPASPRVLLSARPFVRASADRGPERFGPRAERSRAQRGAPGPEIAERGPGPVAQGRGRAAGFVAVEAACPSRG